MQRTLDVYLHRQLIGKLIQNNHGLMMFEYAENWLTNPTAIPLSHSLPLTRKHFNRNDCKAFFAGILPDESKREIIARNLGISAKNDFAMLEQIGGECAGAVTFMPEGKSPAAHENTYRPISRIELAGILKTLPRRPLLAGDEGIRLSLAGAQDKVVVHVSGGQISIPLNGAPSTHILKPAIERFAGVVFNEALCMQLARAISLSVVNVEIGNVEGTDYLLVERYDRAWSEDTGSLTREHQEDFCQALGIVPEHKYQNEGGPSLKQCFDLVRAASSTPVIDLQVLLDAVIFNFLIGNNDAHGKNFSLLYHGEINSGRQTRLAPLYDLVSTVFYPELSPKMAMKIGGEYLGDRVAVTHFERLAEEAGFAKPMIKRRVLELAQMILSALPPITADHPVTMAVAKLIQLRCEGVVRKFAQKTSS
jgi:serine/threonine-protein kinase HipA